MTLGFAGLRLSAAAEVPPKLNGAVQVVPLLAVREAPASVETTITPGVLGSAVRNFAAPGMLVPKADQEVPELRVWNIDAEFKGRLACTAETAGNSPDSV
jgi:hypothetical protein